ncbi:pentatricopeptide repeat-containing protein-like [Dorcoceras hygrometricum]|uniref:Pentatricopeptide repeat-containing protein-like n=1 Tax=Dorcoceras hygrometricum TaxID=472368 RepID=A0A2Z7CU56_9LAMI|nr:pentatricopeptide repeat-containing protein-like [Dorcoceras hygrometricum]
MFRTIKPHQFTQFSAFTSLSDNYLDNVSIVNEVLSLINSVYSMEISLNKLYPFLNCEIVVSVLQSQAQLKNDPRICFRFFTWATGKKEFRSGVSHNLIVNMLLSGNAFDLYWSVLDDLRNEKMPVYADAFVVLTLGYWRLKNAEKVVETFGKMKDYECKPNLAAYNIILHVLVQKKVINLALAIYHKMMKLNYKMGRDTFNVLIDGLCKNGMTENALILFDEMNSRGILPDRITYTIIISGLCKAKRTGDALRLLNLMKSRGCRPDVITYNALLDGLCKFGRVDEALLLFESLKNEGYHVDIRGFSCLIEGLIRTKEIGMAEELFSNIFEVKLVPDVVLYTIMMRGLSEAGRMEDATKLLSNMIAKGVMPDTQCYNVLIKGFCDVGLLDKARSLKLEISQKNQFPNTCTYTILICGLCRNGLLGEAQQIFNDMEKVGCLPSVVTFNSLIDGLCKAGKLEEARLMHYKLEIGRNPSLFLRLSQGTDRVLDSVSLQKMVEKLVDSGLILKAYKILVQLIDSGAVPLTRTYNTLINGMCKAGQINGAFKLFEELQHKGLSPDSVTYATLIDGLQRSDREVDAFKLFEQMNKNGCVPTLCVYQTLMTWSCRRNKITVAYGLWLKYLRSLGEDDSLKLVEECFMKGEYENAVRRLLERGIKLIDFNSEPYNIWLIGLCQSKRIKEAYRTFLILKEFGIVVSAPGCVKLIHALCCEGNLDQAVEIFLYSMEKGYILMPRICNHLLEVLFSKDEAMLAFEVLDKMKFVGYDLDSYLHRSTKLLLYSHRRL